MVKLGNRQKGATQSRVDAAHFANYVKSSRQIDLRLPGMQGDGAGASDS